MRLPVLGPRDVISALERGGEQVEALMGAVPRVLGLLDVAEVLLQFDHGRDDGGGDPDRARADADQEVALAGLV